MAPIPKRQKKSQRRAAPQQGGGDSAVVVIVRQRWLRRHCGSGGSATLSWHDRGSRRNVRRRGCDEDTGGRQHTIIGRSTVVGSAEAVAMAATACR